MQKQPGKADHCMQVCKLFDAFALFGSFSCQYKNKKKIFATIFKPDQYFHVSLIIIDNHESEMWTFTVGITIIYLQTLSQQT